MSKRQVWVIECSDRGKDDWQPLPGESFNDEERAQRNLRDFVGSPRALREYRLTKYVPETK